MIVGSGLLGPEPYRALQRMFESLWAGVLGGESEDFTAALLWFLFFIAVSNLLPLLVSFLVLRRRRYVLTTLASSLVLWGLASTYNTFVATPAAVLRSFELEERHRTSVAIDTLTYELADRLPVKPQPIYGDGFGRLRLILVLDVVEPGETRVNVEFKGHQSARDIKKSKTLHLARGKQRIEFEFVTADFTYRRSVWIVPGNNPDLHPSWLEGWKCYANVEVERPMPGRPAVVEKLWRQNDRHTFVLHGIEEHDAPEP